MTAATNVVLLSAQFNERENARSNKNPQGWQGSDQLLVGVQGVCGTDKLTVSDNEPAEEGTQVVCIEPPPSTDSEPLETNAQSLPPTVGGVEQIFFGGSVDNATKLRGPRNETPDERYIVLSDLWWMQSLFGGR